MRVTIGQINTINGDFESNTPISSAASNRRNERTPILVVFPETCIQGYTSLDWFLDRDVQRCALEPLQEDHRRNAGNHRHRRHRKTIRSDHRTTSLQLRRRHSQSKTPRLFRQDAAPEYDVFDDPRYFQPGAERHLFSWQEEKLGVAVCEDFWNDKTFWRERLYANDPADELIELGAEVLISINASPFNKGKMGQRCAMVVPSRHDGENSDRVCESRRR